MYISRYKQRCKGCQTYPFSARYILELGVKGGLNHKLGYNILFIDQGISWYLVFWKHGILVSWYPGIWYPGNMVSRYSGILVSWYPCILVSRYPGILVSWYPGILISWYNGILVSWYPGILVSWYTGLIYFLDDRIVCFITLYKL